MFLQGLGALLPTLVTIIIVVKLVSFVNDTFGKYIGSGLTYAVAWKFPGTFNPDEKQIQKYLSSQGHDISSISAERYSELRSNAYTVLQAKNIEDTATSWQMSVFGFLVAIAAVCVIGLLLASLIGRRLWRSVEGTVTQLPVIKQIYPHVKQVTDYLFGERRVEFSQVVAVQYPRKGIWSVGFVTGPAIKSLREVDENLITIFIPSSPTPLTGYVITVSKEDTIDLPINIDQTFRYLISGGVITPDIRLGDIQANKAGEPGHGGEETDKEEKRS